METTKKEVRMTICGFCMEKLVLDEADWCVIYDGEWPLHPECHQEECYTGDCFPQ